MNQLPIYYIILSAVYSFLLIWVFKKSQKHQLNTQLALDISLILMVGGFIGGRLGHVFYENWEYYRLHPLEIIQFWRGGFVFYGGFIFGITAAMIFVAIKKESVFLWADFFTPIGALGYSLGRWSCFWAGCCYGRFCEFPWAVKWSWDLSQTPRHPTQIYASGIEFISFLLLLFIEKKVSKNSLPKKWTSLLGQKGNLFFIWMVLHSVGRLIMEYFRDDFRGSQWLGLSISSWISWILLGGAITYLLLKNRSNLIIANQKTEQN